LSAAGPVYTDPQKADADFPYQGEYEGVIDTDDGERRLGIQVIALGEGKFEAVAYEEGLPGAGWNQQEPRRVQGSLQGGRVVFEGDEGRGILRQGRILVLTSSGDEIG